MPPSWAPGTAWQIRLPPARQRLLSWRRAGGGLGGPPRGCKGRHSSCAGRDCGATQMHHGPPASLGQACRLRPEPARCPHQTFPPDVEVPARVAGDSVSVLSEGHAQDILGLLVFLRRNAGQGGEWGERMSLSAGRAPPQGAQDTALNVLPHRSTNPREAFCTPTPSLP